MSRSRLLARALGIALSLLTLAPSGAVARKQRELPYGFTQTWNAALRLVRVDLKLPVTDRDQDGGYVMFDYVSAGKRHPGSIELVAQEGGARPATVVVVQVQGMPSYVEQMLLDKLGKKLLEEHGEPPPPPKPPPPPPAPPSADAGAPEPTPET